MIARENNIYNAVAILCRNNKTLVPGLPPHTPHLSTESFSSQPDVAKKHILIQMTICNVKYQCVGIIFSLSSLFTIGWRHYVFRSRGKVTKVEGGGRLI